MKLIVAGSRRSAESTALDWGWQRGPNGFIDKSGDTVRYVDRLDQLYGLPRGGVIVFLGHEWYANLELRGLQDICASRKYRMTYGDVNGQSGMG